MEPYYESPKNFHVWKLVGCPFSAETRWSFAMSTTSLRNILSVNLPAPDWIGSRVANFKDSCNDQCTWHSWILQGACHHVIMFHHELWMQYILETIDRLCRRRITWSLQSKTATHICFHLASIWRILHARVALSNSTSEGCFAAPSFLKHDLGQWCILPFFNLSSTEIPTKIH